MVPDVSGGISDGRGLENKAKQDWKSCWGYLEKLWLLPEILEVEEEGVLGKVQYCVPVCSTYCSVKSPVDDYDWRLSSTAEASMKIWHGLLYAHSRSIALSHLTRLSCSSCVLPQMSDLYRQLLYEIDSGNYDSNPFCTNKPFSNELSTYCNNIRSQHIIAFTSCIANLYVMSDGC